MQVLVFHKTAGFRHDSIPAGIQAIVALGEDKGYAVMASDDALIFTDTGLVDYDVIVFLNTTGDILDNRQQEAMEGFIQDGKGFVGVHSAADTEYGWPWYEGLVGAYFENHPAPQAATVRVRLPDHPVMRGLSLTFERFDEWYNFRSQPDPPISILAALDESTYEGGGMGDSHPIVWAHQYGGGRSVYTGFGHTLESFSEPLVRDLLTNAIQWAASGDPT